MAQCKRGFINEFFGNRNNNQINMNLRFTSLAIALLIVLTSCGAPKNIRYFQDLAADSVTIERAVVQAKGITIEPNDRVSIVLNSKDPELSNLFNLPIVSNRVGMISSPYSNQNQAVSTYVVDTQGTIDFPVLGKVMIGGLTRHEAAGLIKGKLLEQHLVKDPVVTVEIINLFVSVMGEVAKPGRYNVDRDKLTVLDALAMAGDLTIFGKRDNVLVLRVEDGKQLTYHLDLRSGERLLHSPAFYLKQNDVVYVEPNNFRARQATVNGNNVLSTSFWISLASLATTVAVLIFR